MVALPVSAITGLLVFGLRNTTVDGGAARRFG